MSLIKLAIWIGYGLIVGMIAQTIHPGKEGGGLLGTFVVGVIGCFVGGFINWCLGNGTSPLQASGMIFGVIGGIVALALWHYWNKLSRS